MLEEMGQLQISSVKIIKHNRVISVSIISFNFMSVMLSIEKFD